MLSQEQIDAVTQKIADDYKPEKIILFGSYAIGNPEANSDLDLLIIKQTATPFHKRPREVRKYLPNPLCSLDVLVYTPQEYDTYKNRCGSFLNQILRDGKICYESDTGKLDANCGK
ncbi:nucleotidyltransferase domain-containing protein [Candidatus Poribacteria bacterium]|nr:nucleotidyltransferase domain-containing protein [Candidatus Poribacteria bacterium]